MLAAPVESARLFYATQRGNFDRVPVVINESARRFGFRLLEIVDEAISGGELVAYPREKACELCDYRPVCGPYEETRVRTKDGGEIVERVAEIRRMP
jgi:CRISPR/Cas system-associated exonuclease Cas4 (RecB family)